MPPYVRGTAAQCFAAIKKPEDFWIARGNFLDDFYSADDPERLRMISQPIDRTLIAPDTFRFAVYFAGMVDFLCWAYKVECPAWVQDEDYRLSEPWFLYENWRFRAWQLATTPPHFSSRNIYTGDNPVSRDGQGPRWTKHDWDRNEHEPVKP